MRKALVFYLYGNRNAGDMAICVGAIEVLKSMHYDVTLVSRFSEAEDEYRISKSYIEKYYPDIKVYPGPFSFERDFSVAKKLRAYSVSFGKVCGIIADKTTKTLIDEHDMVFFNGGNLLRGDSLKDYLRLVALFYPIELAKKAGKPVYCLPQSTAKISKIGRKLLGRYLKCFQTVYIRENRSLTKMQRLFPEIRFERSADLAFFCRDTKLAKEEYQKRYDSLPTETCVAIVLRNSGIGDIGRIDHETEERLKDTLYSYIEKHTEYKYRIILQTSKDRMFSEQFTQMISERVHVQIIEEHDPLVLRELYKRMKFLITMRLHAGILALSAHTPVVGLFCEDWGLKNPGIMEDFGMPYTMAGDDEQDLETLIHRIPEDASLKISERIKDFQGRFRFDL